MTRNQIEYQKHLETARSNRTQERETERSHKESERLTAATLGESIRHNRAQEDIGYGNLLETSRHNVSSEAIQTRSLEESIRHNAQAEAETNRHNVQTESEALRHNTASESISRDNLTLGWANLAEQTAKTAETIRHNVTSENETVRHNVVMEAKQWILPETSINITNTPTLVSDVRSDTQRRPTEVLENKQLLQKPEQQTLLQPTILDVDATHSSGKFSNLKDEPYFYLEKWKEGMKDDWNGWFTIQ